MTDESKEALILDFPSLDAPHDAIIQRKNRHIPIKAAAVILAIVSALFHIILIAEAIDILKNKSSDFLFSVVVPDYEISKPTTPAPPEGELIKNDIPKKEDVESVTIRHEELSTSAEYGYSLSNETSYSPDLLAIGGRPSPALSYSKIVDLYGKSSPKVLIYHTHATEAFIECASANFRSTDAENSIVSVGEVICEVLSRAGIEAIHLSDKFDIENFSSAYDKSNSKVKSILEKYPSVQYVFDIHRDCIGNESEGYVKSTCDVYDTKAAQLMFVCGTDEGGSGHSSWRDNLTVALHLQKDLWQRYDRFVRPINLRRASFYQNTRPASLLVECGTCANTLSESKRAAVLFAVTLANYIKGKDCGLDAEELIRTLCP